MSWLAVVLGLLAKRIETATSFTFLIMFLPYVSSAFVPTDTMPTWLQAFVVYQPNNAWVTSLWFGGLLIIAFVAEIIIFERRKKK